MRVCTCTHPQDDEQHALEVADAEGLQLVKKRAREGQPGPLTNLTISSGKTAASRKSRWRKLQSKIRSQMRGRTRPKPRSAKAVVPATKPDADAAPVVDERKKEPGRSTSLRPRISSRPSGAARGSTI